MSRRFIGSGVTDNQGRVSIPYTGVGAGIINIVAECGEGNEKITSETYELIDALFYDVGTSAPAENTWVMSGFTPSYDANGTTLISTEFATCFANKKGTGLNVFDWDSPLCIEFYIGQVDSSNADIQVYDNTNNATRSFNALGINGNNHVKILVESDRIRFFVDDVEKTSSQITVTMSTFRVGLRGTGTITFKNFMIYSI